MGTEEGSSRSIHEGSGRAQETETHEEVQKRIEQLSSLSQTMQHRLYQIDRDLNAIRMELRRNVLRSKSVGFRGYL